MFVFLLFLPLLWKLLHWVHGLIHDWKTFLAVLFLGFLQTVIVRKSGYLAVKGIEGTISGKEKHDHYRTFTILAVALFLVTACAGYLNDSSQHQAKVMADDAVARQQKLQATVDRQNQLITRADVGVTQVRQTVKNGGSTASLANQLEEIQQTLASGLQPKSVSTPTRPDAVSTPSHLDDATQPPQVTKESLSLMSNVELRDSVLGFLSNIGKDGRYDDLQHRLFKSQQAIDSLSPNTDKATQQRASEQLAYTRREYTELVNSIVQSDIPLANLYRAELIRRLGPQSSGTQAIPESPEGVGLFLSYRMLLGEWARKLPVQDKQLLP
jgi:hypothetical protein